MFFTYNGRRLNAAFRGVYVPREAHDVYAAIGVGGPGRNEFVVNFGGEGTDRPLRWTAGREWGWSVDHVSAGPGSGLPAYEDVGNL